MILTPASFLRSLLFNLCFFAWSMLSSLIFMPCFLYSARASVAGGKPWAKGTLLLVRLICGLKFEIRGAEHMVDAPYVYASKHQSAWDTIIFWTLFTWPAFVLKRELLGIPLWGWYLWRMKMIAINRHAGASSMKDMIRQSKEALADRRPIIIFPEGTRTKPRAEPHYHPGILALYSQLKVPVVPVALNSGCFWGKNAFTKHPGTIIIEFLPPIAPGLSKDVFKTQLEDAIETATNRLIAEAEAKH